MGIYQPGEVVEGKYRVIKLLGEGGMNRVYLVESQQGGKQYAMKVSRDPSELQSSQQEIYNQFLAEIAILTTIKHSHLPTVSDYFSSGNSYYVIQEYIDGKTLAEHLKSSKPGELEVLQWSIVLCDILTAIHNSKVVFRDLKPANIMFTASGKLMLIDFDIARHYKQGKLKDTTLLGTPGYAAPETYGVAQSDARSDIYSLGATMHQLLTGKDPQDNPFQFKNISSLCPGIDGALIRVIEKALQKDPVQRYKNASQMQRELKKIQKRLAPATPAPARRPIQAPSRPPVSQPVQAPGQKTAQSSGWHGTGNVGLDIILVVGEILLAIILFLISMRNCWGELFKCFTDP